MDPKQKMVMGIFGGISGVVVLGLAVLLFMQAGKMSEAETQRNDNEALLTSHYSKRPTLDKTSGEMKGAYPSKANREVRQADEAAYTAVADDARELLTHSLPIPESETPSQFVTRISGVVRTLNERQEESQNPAARNKSPNEQTKDYSFGRYVVNGEMPTEENVKHLAEQFAVIEHVCKLLLDNGASEIMTVTRNEFDKAEAKEAPAQNTRSSRRRGRQEETPKATGSTEVDPILAKDGVTCESYSVTFATRYASLVPVLNTLSTEALFVVVTDVAITSDFGLPAHMQKIVDARKQQANKRRGKDETVELKDLFAEATVADRVLIDPEYSKPLHVTLKFDVYSVPPVEAEAPDADETKGN